jgi:uncharacterized protein YjbI with pentapeptide repeats
MLAVFGLGGGEFLILVVALLFFGGLVIAGIGLAVALGLRLSNRQPAALPLSKEPAGTAPVVPTEPLKDHANLAGSRFRNANLTGAEFDNVNLTNARFHNVNLSNAVITAAQIGGASMKHVGPPPDAEGIQARQRPVRFEEMMLCDSTFRKVDLSNVRISDCDLTGATIDGILVTDLMAAYRKQEGGGREKSVGEPPSGV